MAQSALGEWRRHPLLPIAAALGYATSVLHVYGLGPYIEPISREFGWSRTQTTAGLTLATLLQCLGSIPVGMAVDRLGARPLGLVGALLLPAAFALLSTATGGKANWYRRTAKLFSTSRRSANSPWRSCSPHWTSRRQAPAATSARRLHRDG
jgi:MFS family permease